MGSSKNIVEYIKDLEQRLESQMPKVHEAIRVYEKKVKEGKLTANPTPGPQFNEQT